MLKIISLENAELWDRTVESFAGYDVHYLHGFSEAFAIAERNEPLLIYGESEGVRAMLVVIRRDIAECPFFADRLEKGRYFDFVSPYGYGGWLIEGEGNPQPVFDEYKSWCEDSGVVSEFIRFSLFSNSIGCYYGQVIPRISNVVVSLDRPFDGMLMSFEHKVRKNYKRALASGLSLIIDEDGKYLDDYLRIYYGTMERDNAEQSFFFSRDFYERLTSMGGHSVYFHAVKDGVIISTELVLIGTDKMYSFLGGTDSEYFEFRPNDYLKVEIIKWGLEQGINRFILGGGYGSDDGIFRYKKSFAPEGIYQFSTGQYVFNQKAYDELVGMRNDIPEGGYFPKYRAQ